MTNEADSHVCASRLQIDEQLALLASSDQTQVSNCANAAVGSTHVTG